MGNVKRQVRPRGQALVEYVLILSLVGVVAIAILWLLGGGVSNAYRQVNCALDSSTFDANDAACVAVAANSGGDADTGDPADRYPTATPSAVVDGSPTPTSTATSDNPADRYPTATQDSNPSGGDTPTPTSTTSGNGNPTQTATPTSGSSGGANTSTPTNSSTDGGSGGRHTPTPDGTSTPTATATTTPTHMPPTSTYTYTPVPPTSTQTYTPVPPTSTATFTPTATPTQTKASLTSTPTNTTIPPTSTRTNTPIPPTSTRTSTPTITPIPSPADGYIDFPQGKEIRGEEGDTVYVTVNYGNAGGEAIIDAYMECEIRGNNDAVFGAGTSTSPFSYTTDADNQKLTTQTFNLSGGQSYSIQLVTVLENDDDVEFRCRLYEDAFGRDHKVADEKIKIKVD